MPHLPYHRQMLMWTALPRLLLWSQKCRCLSPKNRGPSRQSLEPPGGVFTGGQRWGSQVVPRLAGISSQADTHCGTSSRTPRQQMLPTGLGQGRTGGVSRTTSVTELMRQGGTSPGAELYRESVAFSSFLPENELPFQLPVNRHAENISMARVIT